MSSLNDFTNSDSDEQTDRFDRSKKPKVEREYPVKDPDDGTTLFGMIGTDSRRDGAQVYTSPRHRSRNYFRKIGGYPISTDILERLRAPPHDAGVDPVKIVYIIQRESTDDRPAMTVFEYDLRDYLDAETINFSGFGEQKCPTLDDARAVWNGWGNAMFENGGL
jgi:hypothetical protein